MKKYDLFSRFENNVYNICAFLFLIGLPLFSLSSIYILDTLYLRELSPLLRYPLWVLSAIIVFVIGFVIGFILLGIVDESFHRIRKIFGMKSLSEIDREIAYERKDGDA